MAKWPEILAVASKYQGKPIAFIGVSSGLSRTAVASYARQNRITLPIIVDTDRSFEARCGVPKVSLENIWQVRTVTPKGQIGLGNARQPEATAAKAVEGAEWNVDPAEIPMALRPSWAFVEFGNYRAAAVSLKRYLKSRKEEDKAAAEKLQAYVVEQRDEQLRLAAAAMKDEQNWEAFQAYSSIQQMFRGFEVPKEVAQHVKTLRADDAVKIELDALKRLKAASRALAGAKSDSARERGLKFLQKIADDFPETDAAAQAKSLLDDLKETTTP